MMSGHVSLYRGCTPVVDVQYEAERDDSVTSVVVEAIADAAGTDPVDLPPLFDFIDPDALEQLFSAPAGGPADEATLSFQFDTWNVFVRSDGRILVCDRTRPTEPAPVFEPVPS